MNLYIGADSQSGLAHSAVVTAANVHDEHPLPDLLHGNEQRVSGDSAYASQKDLIASKAPNAKDFTNQRTRYAGPHRRGGVRKEPKQVKNPFTRGACVWRGQTLVGFGKVRHRGLHKNATRAFSAWALANFYLGRQRLMAQVRP